MVLYRQTHPHTLCFSPNLIIWTFLILLQTFGKGLFYWLCDIHGLCESSTLYFLLAISLVVIITYIPSSIINNSLVKTFMHPDFLYIFNDLLEITFH